MILSICLGSWTCRYSYSSSEYLHTSSAGGALAMARVNNAPRRVVDRINKLVQLLLLVLRKRARLLVAARKVNIHVGRHFGVLRGFGGRGRAGMLVCSCSGVREVDGRWGGSRRSRIRWSRMDRCGRGCGRGRKRGRGRGRGRKCCGCAYATTVKGKPSGERKSVWRRTATSCCLHQ
jgi:hypothetical protein